MDMEMDDLATQPPFAPPTPGLAFVVDDMEVNRILARAHLEMLGWEVAEADSGTRALSFLHERTPELMLIDIRMPGLSGDQLARRLRLTHGPRMRLLAYTAHCMQDEVQSFLSSGFDQVLIKPVSFAEMSAAAGRPVYDPATVRFWEA